MKCRIAYHIVKWALCCPQAPAVPLLSPTRARQVHYLPGGRLSSAGLAGVLGSAESASSAAWDRAERSAPFVFCPSS